MFSWFKTKTPEPKKDWEILKNGRGEYFVRRIIDYNYLPTTAVFAACDYFKNKVFGNQIQAEQAIYTWQADQDLKKQTHVKYL